MRPDHLLPAGAKTSRWPTPAATTTIPRRFLRSFGARRPRSAQVWACATLVLAMVTSVVVQGLTSPDGTNPASVGTAVVVLAGAGLLLRLPAARVAPLLVLVPLVGIAVIVKLDLPSGDAGVTGQVFFAIPVVWAAAHLREGAVALVTGSAVAGLGVVAFSLLPFAEALRDVVLLSTLLVVIAAVLSRSYSLQERLVTRWRTLADVDPLTGLATRRVLDEALVHAGTGAGTPGALMLLDLDHFKSLNDTHGHLGGDAALQHVANLLATVRREGDVVARMGGDELAVFMAGSSGDEAGHRASSLVVAVRENPLRLPDGTTVSLSVSAGMAVVTAADPRSAGGNDPYARADAALYAAKRAGRDRLVRAGD